jgi:hypothetical protein
MGRNIPVRLLVATALAAGTLTTISVATPSGAASPVSCAKQTSGKPVGTGDVVKTTGNLSKCTGLPGATTAKTVATVNTKTLKATTKTTWAGGKGTTTANIKYKVEKTLRKCPKAAAGAPANTRITVTATVTGGTGPAAKVIKKGSVGKSSVCVNGKTSTSTNEPGTKITF